MVVSSRAHSREGCDGGELEYFVRVFGDNEYVDLVWDEMGRRGIDTFPRV